MHYRPETRAQPFPSLAPAAPAQAFARHRVIPWKSTAGVAFPTRHPRAKAAWTNTLALAAVAVAIALLVIKNRDRNSSSQPLKGPAIFEVSRQTQANP